MSESKHTPGELEVGPSSIRGGEIERTLTRRGVRVCSISYRADSPTAGEALMTLIAAAPKLLDVLGFVARWIDGDDTLDDGEITRLVKSAIAKATD